MDSAAAAPSVPVPAAGSASAAEPEAASSAAASAAAAAPATTAAATSGSGATTAGKDNSALVAELEAVVAVAEASLQKVTDEHGEMAPEAAAFYFRYGDALLKLAEERMDVLGGGMSAVQHPAGAAADGQPQQQAETVEELLQISWEVLDVARTLFSKLPDHGATGEYVADGPAELFAFTFQRLADLQTLNEEYDGAVGDYKECVEQMKRAKMFRSDRATIYLSLGHTEMLRQKYDDAMRYLTAAAGIFETLVREHVSPGSQAAAAKSNGKGKGKGKGKRKAAAPRDEEAKAQRLSTAPQADDNRKAAQFRRQLKEVYDLIDSCRAELDAPPVPADAAAAGTGAAGAKKAGATTSIGFSGGGGGGGATTIGFGNVAINEAEVQTVQIRKKPRNQEGDPPAAKAPAPAPAAPKS